MKLTRFFSTHGFYSRPPYAQQQGGALSRRRLSHLLLALFLITLFGGQTLPLVAAPDPQTATAPRRVKVNFFINAIRHIDSNAGAYEVDLYLDLYWLDSALGRKTVEEVDPATLWNPQLELVNAQESKILFQIYASSLEADTNVRASYRIVGTYIGRFDLHKFPFDQQTLVITLSSFNYDSRELLFDFLTLDQPVVPSEKPYVQSIPLGKYVAPDLHLDEWQIDGVRIVQQIKLLEYDKSTWSQFHIEVPLTRQSSAYLWRIVAVVFLLIFLTWGVLLIEPGELRFRLLVLFTLLLATITFDYATVTLRPQAAYLTVIDLYFVAAYFFFTLVALVVFGAFLGEQNNQPGLVSRINRLALWLYLPLALVVTGAIFWYGLS
jgi:hypothetical protein